MTLDLRRHQRSNGAPGVVRKKEDDGERFFFFFFLNASEKNTTSVEDLVQKPCGLWLQSFHGLKYIKGRPSNNFVPIRYIPVKLARSWPFGFEVGWKVHV